MVPPISSRWMVRPVTPAGADACCPSWPEPRNRSETDVVCASDVHQRLAGRTASERLAPLLRGELRLAPELHSARLSALPSFGSARPDQIALHIGEPAEHGNHQAAGRG